MKTRYDKYILTLIRKRDNLKTKLYFNNYLNVHKELDAKNYKCVWYWIGIQFDEILSFYKDTHILIT